MGSLGGKERKADLKILQNIRASSNAREIKSPGKAAKRIEREWNGGKSAPLKRKIL